MEPQKNPSNSSVPMPSSEFANYRENLAPVSVKPVAPATPNIPIAPSPAPTVSTPPPAPPASPLTQPYRPFPTTPFEPKMDVLPKTPFQAKPQITSAPVRPTMSVPPTSMPPMSPAASQQQSTPANIPPNISPLPPLSRPGLNTPMMAQRRSHSWKWLGILLTVLVIIAGGAAVVYALVLSPSANIPAAVAGIDSAKKIHSELTVSLTSDNPQFNGASFSVIGSTDRSGPGTANTDALIDIETTQGGISGDIRLVGSTLYGELNHVPALYSSQAASITNRWYSLSLDTLKTLSTKPGAASSSLVYSKPPALAVIYSFLQSSGVISAPSFAGFGMSMGKPVRLYKTTIDKNAWANLAMSANPFMTSSRYVSSVSPVASSVLDSFTFSPVTIMTDLFSGSLRGISGDITISIPTSIVSLASSTTVAKSASNSIRMHIVMSYDDTQTNLSVTAPTNVTPLDQMIMGQVISTNDKNAKVQYDVVQIGIAIQNYYTPAKGYSGACTKSKIVQNLLADIRSVTSAPLCRDSAKAYIISAQNIATLTETSSSYFCFDSTGEEGTQTKLPTGFTCK